MCESIGNARERSWRRPPKLKNVTRKNSFCAEVDCCSLAVSSTMFLLRVAPASILDQHSTLHKLRYGCSEPDVNPKGR